MVECTGGKSRITAPLVTQNPTKVSVRVSPPPPTQPFPSVSFTPFPLPPLPPPSPSPLTPLSRPPSLLCPLLPPSPSLLSPGPSPSLLLFSSGLHVSSLRLSSNHPPTNHVKRTVSEKHYLPYYTCCLG